MKLTCCIIDDEPLAVELLKSYALKTDVLQLENTFSGGAQAMAYLQTHSVDLLFCDIQMPEIDGLALSKMLPEHTKVVFTTAFERYALDGFKVNALDYLLKPIAYADFLQAVNKAVKWFSLQNDWTPTQETSAQTVAETTQAGMFVKADYKMVWVDFTHILYIEGLKDYVKIYLDNGERPIHTLLNMKLLEEKLPTTMFARIHRSFIVNLKQVRVIDKGRVVFGQTYLPVSDNYKEAFTKFVQEHLL